MNLKLKDIVTIALVTLFSFPVIYAVMLFATGVARVEFDAPVENSDRGPKVELQKSSVRKDSLALLNSKTYQALRLERDEITKERARLLEQEQRVDLLAQEVEKRRLLLEEERKKIEASVEKSKELNNVKVKQLAKVYGSMRPVEAAQIMETLDDVLTINILNNLGDDRQKAKIMGALSKEKASRISTKMGG